MSDKPASPARGRKKTAPPAQQPPQEEVVVRLPLTDLYPFPDHPFQVRDDEEMRETIQSVKEYGVIVPAIVRPREEGGYEIVAGHRRKYACEQAGLDTMPVLIRNLDRDAATIIMVDSNLQRENILPSERAKAYKMKLEAIKRQGARNDLTSPKISAKLRSDDEIGQQMGVSGDTVRNYISLTNLVPELMQMVDEKKIALSPAYQIAALKPEEQQMLVTTIDYEQATPSLSQAQRMKKFSQAGRLNEDSMLAIMSEEKKPEKFSLTFDGDRIRKYRGFAMSVSFDAFRQEYTLQLKGQMTHQATLGADPRGNLTRIDNALAQMPQRLESVKAQLDNLYQQQAAAKEEVGRPFPYEDELREKSARLTELDTLLNIDSKAPGPQETIVAKSTRPSVLEGLRRPMPPRAADKKSKTHEEVR